MDHLHAVRGIGEELLEQLTCVIETELDAEGLRGEQPLDGFAVVHVAGSTDGFA